MVELVLVHRSIPVIMHMVTIFALQSYLLTFFANMFLEFWERYFFASTTKALQIVTWAFASLNMPFKLTY